MTVKYSVSQKVLIWFSKSFILVINIIKYVLTVTITSCTPLHKHDSYLEVEGSGELCDCAVGESVEEACAEREAEDCACAESTEGRGAAPSLRAQTADDSRLANRYIAMRTSTQLWGRHAG